MSPYSYERPSLPLQASPKLAAQLLHVDCKRCAWLQCYAYKPPIYPLNADASPTRRLQRHQHLRQAFDKPGASLPELDRKLWHRLVCESGVCIVLEGSGPWQYVLASHRIQRCRRYSPCLQPPPCPSFSVCLRAQRFVTTRSPRLAYASLSLVLRSFDPGPGCGTPK